MKKTIVVVTLLALLTLCACITESDKIQGVRVASDGSVAVTFRVPETSTLEDVLGRQLGKEGHIAMNAVGGGLRTCSWAEIENGGLVTWSGNLACYCPTMKAGSRPSAFVMVDPYSEESEILQPEDADELKQRYGIELHF